MHEFLATSTPVRSKVKATGRRKPRNSRRSVSLLDVSAVETKPDVSSQISESNETLASGFKDSGYVRSDVSSLYDDDSKEAKNLVEELKFKDVLICELQESNRGLRLRCADAEDKIWRLRIKCEAHCGCCPRKDSGTVLTPPESGSEENDTRWNRSDTSTLQNRVSQSFSYKPSSTTVPLARSSSTGTLAKPIISKVEDALPLASLSLSKVEKWQKDLTSKVSRPAAPVYESSSSRDQIPKEASIPLKIIRHLDTRPTLLADGEDDRQPNDLVEDSSESSIGENAFHCGLISPIERPEAPIQFRSSSSDDSQSHKASVTGRNYLQKSIVQDPPKSADCHRCTVQPAPYVVVVPSGCCSCCRASTAVSSNASSLWEGQGVHVKAKSDALAHPVAVPVHSQTSPQEPRRYCPNELSANDVDLSGRLTVPFTQGFDPKNEYKRRIEEGMNKLASDARAEADSLSFKPWPVPDFSGMKPLMQCLAETSHYARQMAIGLSKINSRVQRLTDAPDRPFGVSNSPTLGTYQTIGKNHVD